MVHNACHITFCTIFYTSILIVYARISNYVTERYGITNETLTQAWTQLWVRLIATYLIYTVVWPEEKESAFQENVYEAKEPDLSNVQSREPPSSLNMLFRRPNLDRTMSVSLSLCLKPEPISFCIACRNLGIVRRFYAERGRLSFRNRTVIVTATCSGK